MPNEIEKDTKVDRILISSLFWYFGDKSPDIPLQFTSLVFNGRNYKKYPDENVDTEIIRDFVSWVSSEYRPGVLGEPRDSLTEQNNRCDRRKSCP
jgi:hypothetical protein